MSVLPTSFKTKSGLELPLLNLRGKLYLQAAFRVQWFRHENPKGIIKTQLIAQGGEGKDMFYVFKAEIFVDSDKGPMLIATGHKRETVGDFSDAMEKSETGATSRALALCGYGTQFTGDELDEGTRLADSPLPTIEKSSSQLVTETKTTTEATPARRSSFRKNVTLASTATTSNDDI